MHIDFLLEVFEKNCENEAIIWKDKAHTYDWLLSCCSSRARASLPRAHTAL